MLQYNSTVGTLFMYKWTIVNVWNEIIYKPIQFIQLNSICIVFSNSCLSIKNVYCIVRLTILIRYFHIYSKYLNLLPRRWVGVGVSPDGGFAQWGFLPVVTATVILKEIVYLKYHIFITFHKAIRSPSDFAITYAWRQPDFCVIGWLNERDWKYGS